MMLAAAVIAVESEHSNLSDQFAIRYQAWHDWCTQHSYSSDLTSNQPFTDLVALGPQVVPLLLKQAEQEAENGYGVSLV